MNFYPHHATGFTVSALFHGAILASLLYGQMSMQYSPVTSESLSLSLAMFQASQPAVPEKSVTVEKTPAKPKPIVKKIIPAITKKPVASKPKPEPLPQDNSPEKSAEELIEPELIEPVKKSEKNTATKDESENTTDTTDTQAQSSPPSGSTKATGAPALDHGIIESLEARYMSALRNAIEAHKFYPRRARRLKREGKVIIDFTINRSGLIHNVHIAQTSGTKLLDKAALDAVIKLGQFKPIPEKIPHVNWKLEIPMEFTLL